MAQHWFTGGEPELKKPNLQCRALALKIESMRKNISALDRIYVEMNIEYSFTKEDAATALYRLDCQFKDIKNNVEELQREVRRMEHFLNDRTSRHA